jgi:hypothetical protein
MQCLHCGDCCERMSPLSEGPCPYIKRQGTFVFCSRYLRRPKECKNHEFHAQYCPIGVEKLGFTEVEQVHRRIDDGWGLLNNCDPYNMREEYY